MILGETTETKGNTAGIQGVAEGGWAIWTIIYMVDIMRVFFLKLRMKARACLKSFTNRMTTSP